MNLKIGKSKENRFNLHRLHSEYLGAIIMTNAR